MSQAPDSEPGKILDLPRQSLYTQVAFTLKDIAVELFERYLQDLERHLEPGMATEPAFRAALKNLTSSAEDVSFATRD